MSQRLRPLTLSLRALEKAPGPSHVPTRLSRVITSRRSLHASASVRNASVHVGHQAQGQDHASLAHSGHNAFAEEMGPGMLDSGAYAREMRLRHEAEVDKAKQYLDGVFPELDFPRELAQRILTHASHRDARNGHNQRLSFIGRRVIESYFLLFIHSAKLPPEYIIDYANLSERHLNTYYFGEHIGSHLLGRGMRWVPNNEDTYDPRKSTRTVGLYKAAGTTTEALVGGIYHQYGATAAHRLFHTRILPKIPFLPKPLPQLAQEMCDKMGGPTASLLETSGPTPSSATQKQTTKKSGTGLIETPLPPLVAAAEEEHTGKPATFKVQPAAGSPAPARLRDRQTSSSSPLERQKLT